MSEIRPPVHQRFPRLWVVIGIVGLVALGTQRSWAPLIGLRPFARGAAVAQPIAFNHFKHTKDLGLECQFCHPYVTSGAHAGLPGAETCSMCHSTVLGTSPEAARVTALLDQGDPLRFNKLFRLADHVYYTHRRHVGIGQLECSQCHGAIAETQTPPSRPLLRMTMKVCLDCHRVNGQSLDCVACHR